MGQELLEILLRGLRCTSHMTSFQLCLGCSIQRTETEAKKAAPQTAARVLCHLSYGVEVCRLGLQGSVFIRVLSS